MENEQEQDFSGLKEQILYKRTEFGKFKVFDYEASSGKTYNYAKAVVDYYHMTEDFGNDILPETCDKSLIVIKTIEEGKNVANAINQFDSKFVPYKKLYDKLAVAMNTEYKKEHPNIARMSDTEYANFLNSIPVLIITQSEYLNICNNPSIGQVRYGNRKLLIVDEEIDVVFNSFSVLTMHDIARINDVYLKDCSKSKKIFQELTGDFKKELAENSQQMCRVHINKSIESVNSLVMKLHYQLITDISESKLKDLKKYKEFENVKSAVEIQKFIMDKVNGILQFYNNKSVIKNGTNLHTYNSNMKLFTLQNNIWIDASASLNYIYQLDKKTFEIAEKSERLIDHSKSKLIFDVVTKSTTSGKSNYVDLESDILKYIEEIVSLDDKILVIDNLDECEKMNEVIQGGNYPQILLREKYFQMVNFQAMRGRNDWKDFNKIFILQQPQFLLVYYVFLYEFWSGVTLKDKEMYMGTHHDNDAQETIYGFYLPYTLNGAPVEYTADELKHSKELELVRYTSQASSVYQGVKRIQRNRMPIGEMYVILHDNRMRKMVREQLKNVQVDYIDFKPKPKKETEETVVNKFMDLVHSMKPYELKDVTEIANVLNTTVDYVYTMVRRNTALKEIIDSRQIGIVKMCDAVWYLENADEGEVISIDNFMKKFSIKKWDNFRRQKDYSVVRSRRKIIKSDSELKIGKRVV